MAEAAGASLAYEVAFSPGAGEVTRVTCQIRAGATLLAAIHASGMLEKHPEIDLEGMRVGVFGKLRQPGDVVREGDRIEIYRALRIDPKSARRLRAQKKGKT